MYELSTTKGVPDSFQFATSKYRCNYEVNDCVPYSIQVANPKESSNKEVDNSNISNPFKCDILPDVTSDEDETASMGYSKRNPYTSLRFWEGVAFYKTEMALNNSCIWVDYLYRGNKKIHIHKQNSKIYKLVIFKHFNLSHLKYL
jgi:hypothetical protein